jgi:hypothetical protein
VQPLANQTAPAGANETAAAPPAAAAANATASSNTTAAGNQPQISPALQATLNNASEVASAADLRIEFLNSQATQTHTRTCAVRTRAHALATANY